MFESNENNKINNNTYTKQDKKLALFVVMELLLPATKFCIVQSIPGLSIYNNYANIIISFFLLILIVPIIPIILNRSSEISISTLFVLFLLLLIQYLVYPNNRRNISSLLFEIICISYICFVTTYSIRDYEILFLYLKKASYVIIAFGMFMLISTIKYGAVGAAETEYNMSLSYYCLIPTLTMIYVTFKKKEFSSLIFMILGIVIIIGMGSRGPLISSFLFIFIYYTMSIKKSKKKWFLILLFIMFIVVISLFFNKILVTLYNIFESYGINSRTIRALLTNNIFQLSDRDVMIRNSMSLLRDNYILGIGFLGNLSSHNIFVETILFFGIPIGIIISIFLIIVFVKTLSLRSNRDQKAIVLIFFSYAIVDAMLNLSIWGKDIFWLYLGLILSKIRKCRHDKRN